MQGPHGHLSVSWRRSFLSPVEVSLVQLLARVHSGPIANMSAFALAAVSEYVTTEILELAGNGARDEKRVQITPHHIGNAISNDEELSDLCRRVHVGVYQGEQGAGNIS